MKRITLFNQCLILSLLTLTSTTIYGQLVNFIPPSPTAAELAKYGDIPVGNYTGVPNISIPLHTVRSGKLELPISISYHASGVQVQAEASWVGLGWSLNAGGIITRQTNGIDDFLALNGYINDDPLPPINELNAVTLGIHFGIHGEFPTPPPQFRFTRAYQDTYARYELASKGLLDLQPDIFFYNFLGYSGKLIFQKQTGSRLVGTPLDQNNLRFIYDLASQQWEVTDADGIKYFFHTIEVSRSRSSVSVEMTPDVGATEQTEDLTTGWYLDRIEGLNGDEITLEYNRTGRWLASPKYISQRETHAKEMSVNGGDGIAVTDVVQQPAYSASGFYTDEPYLKRINFANGHIIFGRHAEERLDREKWNLSAVTVSPRLSYFEVYDKNNNEIKMVTFDQSYFRDDKLNSDDKELYLRLKLDAVREAYADSSGIYSYLPPYQFTYNSTLLPSKTSFSKDHWGFYNGADNTNIKGYKFYDLPSGAAYHEIHNETTNSKAYVSSKVNYINDSNGVKIYMIGADREPHTTNMMAGILTGIQYPTKGFIKFTYEPNDYWNYTDQSYYETPISHTVTSLGTTEKTFTINESTFVFLQFNLVNNNYTGDPNNTTVMNNMTCVLEKLDGTDILKFIPATQPGGNNNVPSMESYVAVALAPGTYRIKTNHGGYVYLGLTLTAKFMQKVATTKKMGGGIRIKTIENFDRQGGSLAGRKTYEYTEGPNSSGRFLGNIRYYFNESMMIKRFMSPNYFEDCCYLSAIINPTNPPTTNKVIVSSESNLPLGSSAQGSSVGYGIVTVRQENEAGSNLGKSVYYYKNTNDTQPPIFMPSLPQRVFLENGQLTSEHHYDSNNILLREKFLEYLKDVTSSITIEGLMTYKTFNDYYVLQKMDDFYEEYAFPWEDMPVFAAPFSLYSEWWYLSKTIEKQYDQNAVNPKTVITDFTYGSPRHKQVTSQSSTSSTGETVVTNRAYATDSPIGTANLAATLNRMDADNMISPVIKEEVLINDNLVSGIINNYTTNANDLVVQVNSQKLMSYAGAYKNDVEFQQYDAAGRVLQLRLADNISVSYIWGYNNELPIVKAENIDYATLKSAVEAAAGTTNLDVFWETHSAGSYSDHIWKSFNTTLRANPALSNARITTYTFIPLKGMTSATDENGRCIYYEYDSFNRLKYVRNHNGEILNGTSYYYRY